MRDRAGAADRADRTGRTDKAEGPKRRKGGGMIQLSPSTLEGYGVRLEPLGVEHAGALAAAAADGKLWELWYTSVPEPGAEARYISQALDGQEQGQMLPWVVRELSTDTLVGTSRYHDIIATADRVEIGYTWYARSWHRSHVNTATKLLLLGHAFDTVGCRVVGLRTDILNTASQRAIEALGARKDGVIRHHWLRRDGTVRDTVMYSILKSEWAAVRQRLLDRLAAHAPSPR